MIHETTVRVRYGETDRMGVVYHAHYLPYFETGRTEFLRSLGSSYREVEDSGLLLVVTDASLRYRRPARYDEVLLVRTRLASVGGIRMVFEYEVLRAADRAPLVSGHTTLASTDRTGRPVRLPAAFRDLLESVVEPGGKPDTPSPVQGENP